MQSKAAMLAVMAVSAAGDATSPIAKVLQMIDGLAAKLIAEGEASHKVYSDFAKFCEDRHQQIDPEIKTGTSEIEGLKAAMGEADSKIAVATSQVEELAGSIAQDERSLKEATIVRSKENEDFLHVEKDLSETIDMLQRAISVIERQAGGSFAQLKGANGLVQALQSVVAAEQMSVADGKKLTALIQSQNDQSEDDAAFGAPAAAATDGPRTGGIIDTLQGLLDTANEQLDSARKEELQSSRNFDQKKQSLEDEIKYASEDLAEAKKSVAANNENKATAEGDLQVTMKALNEDKSDLAAVHRECMSKASTYEAEVTSRAEELKALAQAKKIIVEATSLAQTESFLQLKSSAKGAKVIHMLKELAADEKSKSLAQLASRAESALRIGTASGSDPFAKIREMTQQMIDKLEAEQAQDATQTAFCDKELKETKAKKEDKEAEVDKLSTKKEQKEAQSAKLKGEVVTLQKELSEMASSLADMTALRAEEKAAYESAAPELKKGIKGIQLAIKTLKEYYANADTSHGDNSGAGGGIIALLEVAETDFIRNLNELVAEEEMAASNFESEGKEMNLVKTTKESDVKYKTKEAVSLDKAVSDLASDAAGVQDELDAVSAAFTSLQTQCTHMPPNFEERNKHRQDEIARLQGTLEELENQMSDDSEAAPAESPEGEATAPEAAPEGADAVEAAAPEAAPESAAAPEAAPEAQEESQAFVQISDKHLRGVRKHA